MRKIWLYMPLLYYIYLLACVLLFKYVPVTEVFQTNRQYIPGTNTMPLHTINHYLMGNYRVSSYSAYINIFGNILIFIPLGIYLSMWQKKATILLILVQSIFISSLIEGTQYVLRLGSYNIDDIMLNALGGMLGAIIYTLLHKVCKTRKRTHRWLITSSVVIALPLMAVEIVLKIINI